MVDEQKPDRATPSANANGLSFATGVLLVSGMLLGGFWATKIKIDQMCHRDPCESATVSLLMTLSAGISLFCVLVALSRPPGKARAKAKPLFLATAGVFSLPPIVSMVMLVTG